MSRDHAGPCHLRVAGTCTLVPELYIRQVQMCKHRLERVLGSFKCRKGCSKEPRRFNWFNEDNMSSIRGRDVPRLDPTSVGFRRSERRGVEEGGGGDEERP